MTITYEEWTAEQAQLPTVLLSLMEEIEYRIAASDAPLVDRYSALGEIQSWCADLRVTLRTGIPMADSDRFPTRVAAYEDNATTRTA